MMRAPAYRILLLFFSIILSAVSGGCDKSSSEEPQIEVSISEYWLGKEADNRASVRFTVNTAWAVSLVYVSDQDRGWLYVTPGSGRDGEHTLTLTTTGTNTSGTVRKAYVDIVYGDTRTYRLTVSQEG